MRVEPFEALKGKRGELVKDKVEAHRQGDRRENFGGKAAEDAIRAADRKMTARDRCVARHTFIEADPVTRPTKPTDTLPLGHGTTKREAGRGDEAKQRLMFLVTTHGETASDPDSGLEFLPPKSPPATARPGPVAGMRTT